MFKLQLQAPLLLISHNKMQLDPELMLILFVGVPSHPLQRVAPQDYLDQPLIAVIPLPRMKHVLFLRLLQDNFTF